MSDSAAAHLPQVFKGIALFTPGGDMAYCIDPEKRLQWHLNLCTALQDHLGLSNPPYFLLPCYTATVDHWIDPTTQELHTVAEAYPRVMRFQALLNVVFGLDSVQWRLNPTVVDHCRPTVIEANRHEFPQLWDHHDLILPVDRIAVTSAPPPEADSIPASPEEPPNHVLRLFVRSDEPVAVEKILVSLRHTLERTLAEPYTLQVVDVTKHPEQAEQANIRATPSLVRAWPLPVRRLVGDLTSPERLAQLFN